MEFSALTKEQNAKIKTYQDKWFKLSTKVGDADRKTAERGALACYEAADIPQPQGIIWFDSPRAMCTAHVLLWGLFNNVDKIVPYLSKYITSDVAEEIKDKIVTHIVEPLSKRDTKLTNKTVDIAGEIFPLLFKSYQGDTLSTNFIVNGMALLFCMKFNKHQLIDALTDLYNALDKDQIEHEIQSQAYRCGYGQFSGSWVAYIDFMREVADEKKATDKLLGIMDIASSAGWWAAYDKLCFISERPVEVHYDEEQQPHSYDRQAILYRDGTGITMFHGIQVPIKYLAPIEDIRIKDVLTESNASVRLAVLKKIGMTRLRTQVPTKVIDTCASGELLEFSLGKELGNVRGLYLKWEDKFGIKLETVLAVPTDKEDFGKMNKSFDPNNAEHVRKWTCWMQPEDEFILET